MKKFILILSAFLMLAVSMQEQDKTTTFRSKSSTYIGEMTLAETIDTGDSIYIMDVNANRNWSYVIDAYASIDSLNYEANDTIFCTIQGKIFSGQSWTDINTQYLKLPTEENVVTWSQITAIYRYKYLRFYLHSKDSDTNWLINSIELKITPATLTDEAN